MLEWHVLPFSSTNTYSVDFLFGIKNVTICLLMGYRPFSQVTIQGTKLGIKIL